MKFIQVDQKGVSIMFSMLIMSFVLAIALGASTILIRQVKVMKDIGDSLVAFYAADSGVEEALYKDYLCHPSGGCATTSPSSFCSLDCSGLSTDFATSTVFSNEANYNINFSSNGTTTIKSTGNYRETKRILQIIR